MIQASVAINRAFELPDCQLKPWQNVTLCFKRSLDFALCMLSQVQIVQCKAWDNPQANPDTPSKSRLAIQILKAVAGHAARSLD